VAIAYELQLRSEYYKNGTEATPWLGRVQHKLPYKEVCGMPPGRRDQEVAGSDTEPPPTVPDFSLSVVGRDYHGDGEMTVTLRYNKVWKSKSIKLEAIPGQPFGGEPAEAVVEAGFSSQHIVGTKSFTVRVNCKNKTDYDQAVLVQYRMRLREGLASDDPYGDPVAATQDKILFSEICYSRIRRPATSAPAAIMEN
jgi:hypothetical protein